MELPPPSVRGYLKEMGIQLDIMDTVGSTTLPAVLLSITLDTFRETRARRTTYSRKRVDGWPLRYSHTPRVHGGHNQYHLCININDPSPHPAMPFVVVRRCSISLRTPYGCSIHWGHFLFVINERSQVLPHSESR
jgi:hypothetical protein